MALTQVDQGLLGQYAQYTGFKNRIINGDMRIAQRGTSSVTNSNVANTFPVDRTFIYGSVANKFTAQQSSTAPANFVNSVVCTSSAATSLGSTDYYQIGQYIEGFNVADLGWGTANAQTVTLSFWVRSSLIGTFGGALGGVNTRSYPFTYTISSANTWEYKTVTVAGDTSGTWGTTNSYGIAVSFGLGTGATYSGTAGAWAGATYLSATGATSVVGTNGATFYITGVQLEKGSTATSFDYRPYGTELALCQRYYYRVTKTSSSSNGLEYVFGMGQLWTNAFQMYLQFPTTMRSSPTFTSSSASTFQYHCGGVASGALASLTSNTATVEGARITGSMTYAGTNGLAAQIAMSNSSTAYMDFSAEL